MCVCVCVGDGLFNLNILFHSVIGITCIFACHISSLVIVEFLFSRKIQLLIRRFIYIPSALVPTTCFHGKQLLSEIVTAIMMH